MKQIQAELQSRHASTLEMVNKLKVSEQEIHLVRVELEKQTNERTKIEQNAQRLHGRIRELQTLVDGHQVDVDKHKKETQEEITQRKRTEVELEDRKSTRLNSSH